MISFLLEGVTSTSLTDNIDTQTIFEKMNEGLFGNIAEFIANWLTLWPILVFMLVLFVFLMTFKKRTKRICMNMTNMLAKNGKYIKGVFAELNDTKELLRYFMNGDKWKSRIILDYNNLFDDKNGKRLKEIYKSYGVDFKIDRLASVKKIYEEISKTLELMRKIRKREYKVAEEFKDTAMLFEVFGHRYIEKLEKLQTRVEFAKNKYIVLTGSAGNGKTNLLCNLVETMAERNKICIFYNAKDITQNMNNYFEENLTIYNSKYFKVYWNIQHFLCVLLNKTVYIIIDAINENESQEFMNSLSDFINQMMKYPKVKIVISCRSEYFDLKYKTILVDDVNGNVYCYDILKEDYTVVAKERLYENYKRAFNYSGEVSIEVKEKLYHQLLLMRMFFEVNRNSDTHINSLNKYEIFQRYIDSILGKEKVEREIFLNRVVAHMYRTNEYSAVMLSDIKKDIDMTGTIKDLMDETILLSRKLVLHENSIIEKQDEEIYFVFDEMRDYCVAKYVLNVFCDKNGNPMQEKVISYIDKLVESSAVCVEGVINYIYWFYKGQDNADMCKVILNKFMKSHDRAMEVYRRNRESGLNSWGLKVIFDGNGKLEVYEKEYLKFIVMENPGHELARLFAFLINQEKINGKYTLDIFLELLFSIHQTETFCNVLKETVSYWNSNEISRSDFIKIDKFLKNNNMEGCKRFRCYLFLFLEFLSWEGKEELQEYFELFCDKQSIGKKLKGRIYFEEGGN